MRIRRIHHLTVAVRDIDAACETFERLFGASRRERLAVPAFGIQTTAIRIGDDELHFAAPMYPDNPVMRFLERKGEGFYNVAIEVEDIDAAVRELHEKGVPVSEPVEAEPGVRSSFVAMAATHGLSIQLVEGAAATAPAQPAPSAAVAPAPASAEDAEPLVKPGTVVDEARAQHTPPPPLDLTPDEWSDVD